ncbi:protein of unknown function [Pseudomonas sp. JV551A1]|uniref:Uncharacterized protein n=1 Tax=Pseudomonas inefficax TaxID=2078786 RepID=A0AAQ1P733_9PSED|nr:protein of unknown function [Pseudomonas sp. JV551A1]SPO60242.1 protein of unknown function [Pseudomonas inefficax]
MWCTAHRSKLDRQADLGRVGAALCRERAAQQPQIQYPCKDRRGRFAALSRYKAAPTKKPHRYQVI